MSNSSVSGPYASAVSIKFAPSSTARFKTLRAFSRSGGQPHIPSPVSRIAPNPSRFTGKSPPMVKLELSLADAAAKIVAALPAKSDAPPESVARRNSRRLIPLQARSQLVSKDSSFIEETYDHMRSFHEASYTTFCFLLKGIRMAAGYDRLAACATQQLLPRIHPFESVKSAVNSPSC